MLSPWPTSIKCIESPLISNVETSPNVLDFLFKTFSIGVLKTKPTPRVIEATTTNIKNLAHVKYFIFFVAVLTALALTLLLLLLFLLLGLFIISPTCFLNAFSAFLFILLLLLFLFLLLSKSSLLLIIFFSCILKFKFNFIYGFLRNYKNDYVF